jgi:uncharacterized protein
VIENLKHLARRLMDQHPEIESVWLFGSLARGEAVPGSDADLLILLSASDIPLRDRFVAYLPTEAPIGVEVFPYTQQEIDDAIAGGSTFLAQVLQERVRLA